MSLSYALGFGERVTIVSKAGIWAILFARVFENKKCVCLSHSEPVSNLTILTNNISDLRVYQT